MRVTFRQLRLFKALAEHGSVSRAARACHVTQPTASMQLREPLCGEASRWSAGLGVKRIDELVWRNASLFEASDESADFYFTVAWDHASHGATAHDDMAATLAGNYEIEAFQRPDNFVG